MVRSDRDGNDLSWWHEVDLIDRWDIIPAAIFGALGIATHLYCRDKPQLDAFELFSFVAYLIATLLVLLFRRLNLVPRMFWVWRPLFKPAVQAARLKIVRLRLNEIIQSTANELISLTSGRFTLDQSPYIPRFSDKALGLVWNRVVLIMDDIKPTTLRFYLNEHGEPNAYYNALKELAGVINQRRAVNEIANEMSPTYPWQAARIFYLGDGEEVTDEVKRFIEQHIKDKIEVRCLERWPDTLSFKPNHNFGYYETKGKEAFVITVEQTPDGRSATAMIHTDPFEVEEYRKLADELCSNASSKSWEDFWPTMLQVMNPQWRHFIATHSKSLDPPHGLSAEDCDSLIESCVRAFNGGDREAFATAKHSVLILGFTKILIEQFKKAGCNVHCLDQSSNRPQLQSVNIHDLEPAGNWLTHQFGQNIIFDIVACDEAINNLRPIQYSTFFQQVKKWLKPRGMFVGRVMGRDGGSRVVDRYGKLNYQASISRLRNLETRGIKSPEDYACEIIPILHSKIIFDDNTEIIDTGKWNKYIDEDQSLSPIEREWWKFPMSLKISSPLFSSLDTSLQAAGFKNIRLDNVIGDYITRFDGCVVGEFYRLFTSQSPD